MNIEYSLVRDLRPYPHNARTHSNKQIRQIAGSIKKFGFCNPVLIDDQKQIIAGHGRVEAAKSLGIDAVPRLGYPISARPKNGPTSWPTTDWRKRPAGIGKFWRSSCRR